MTVTITPEVTANASLAQQACEAASRFSQDFNNRADAAGHAAAKGFEVYSDAWYAAYEAAYRPAMQGRKEWIDQQMVLNGWAGWTLVGSGAFRTAMLGPDGLIYKVGDTHDNRMEAQISEALHKVMDTCPTKGFRILDMKIVGEILVTEYAPRVEEGAPYQYAYEHPEWREFTQWVASHGCGVMDTHEHNVWWDGAYMVIIDMGNWSFKGKTKW